MIARTLQHFESTVRPWISQLVSFLYYVFMVIWCFIKTVYWIFLITFSPFKTLLLGFEIFQVEEQIGLVKQEIPASMKE